LQTVYLLGAGLVALVVATAVRRVPSLQKTVPDWLATALLGALVGGGAAFLSLHLLGYHWTPQSAEGSGPMLGGAGTGGRGPGAPVMNVGGGMGMQGFGGGQNKRRLTDLVWKLELATRGISLDLDEQQAEQIAARLNEIATADTMSDEEAEASVEGLEDLLGEEQRATLETFGRPRRGGGGFGMGMGMGMGMGAGRGQGSGRVARRFGNRVVDCRKTRSALPRWGLSACGGPRRTRPQPPRNAVVILRWIRTLRGRAL
jgi:hypothetical protein